MLTTCCIISLILLVWFRTDAWVEYCRLFGWDAISFYRDFDIQRQSDITLTYHIYLRRYHDCFFVRLITCPICLSIWLGLFATGILTAVGLVFLGILSALTIAINFPLIVIFSIAIYAGIDRLLG